MDLIPDELLLMIMRAVAAFDVEALSATGNPNDCQVSQEIRIETAGSE